MAQQSSLINELIGCNVGDSRAAFVIGWFAIPFMISMLIGLLIEFFNSASPHCVGGSAFQNVTLASLGVAVFTALIAFVIHKFKCSKTVP